MAPFIAFLLVIFSLICSTVNAQISDREKMEIKTGWSFGTLPVFGFDPNIGFKYGVLFNLYDYGDGSSYPRFNQSLNLEWSRSTKGSGVNQLTYDTRKLIPGIRMLAELSWLTEKALNFYGFNGYNAYYNPRFEDKEDSLYLSSVFYRMDRDLFKTKAEFIGNLSGNSFKWFGGFEYFYIRLDTVDLDNLNKGRKPDDLLPPSGGGLYGNYVRWGLIPEDQVDGGSAGVFKIGAKYDTRDNEPNPMKGLWTEVQFLMVPGFLSDGYGYTRMAFTHRQYFTLVPKRLNFVYRLSYQAKLSGEMPFYMLPLVFNSAPQITLSGLGGAKTMRGIVRNRVVGEDFVYGNAELRYKFLRTVILNQNFYAALSCFTDAGMITGKYRLPEITNPAYKAEADYWLGSGDKEEPHISYGGGVHLAFNENFVITMNYARTLDSRDGIKGTFVGLSFLF